MKSIALALMASAIVGLGSLAFGGSADASRATSLAAQNANGACCCEPCPEICPPGCCCD